MVLVRVQPMTSILLLALRRSVKTLLARKHGRVSNATTSHLIKLDHQRTYLYLGPRTLLHRPEHQLPGFCHRRDIVQNHVLKMIDAELQFMLLLRINLE